MDCVRRFAGQIPLLGVCLGHQSIGQATGGEIVRARQLMHGKTDEIHHDNRGLFEGLPNPFTATRYHSLVIAPESLSEDFEVSAWAGVPDGSREIMGIRHKKWPVEGWQFHPESFLTECGHELLCRFLQLTIAP
jgi:anthranilate synthase component 2